MTNTQPSPQSSYRPQVLMLAPESGEDRNVLSLLAQLLELGVAVDFMDDWRLPTEPPRDLSQYQACLFPETARDRYDADVDTFERAGGFLPYYKYYPVMSGDSMSGVHYFVDSFGRDAYMWHCANVLIEAGLDLHAPDFAAAMASRDNASIAADFRDHFMARHGDQADQPWTDWKDPDYIYLTNHTLLADRSGDADWQRVVRSCYDRVAATTDDFLAGPNIQYQLGDVVENYVIMFAALMLRGGMLFGEPRYTDAGLRLGRAWFDANGCETGYRMRGHKVVWSEHAIICEGLYHLARAAGDAAPQRMADNIIEEMVHAVRRDDGLWAHVQHHDGTRSAVWSRGTSWVTHGLAWSLRALEPDSASAMRIGALLNETYDAIAPHQDPQTGLWRLVVDDPATRIESSATAVHVLAWDELSRAGFVAERHRAMIDAAFTGLKRLSYRQGVAACCRGTATGVDSYYRSRPLGYSPGSTHFGGALAGRLDTLVTTESA